jgi:outer membrane protein
MYKKIVLTGLGLVFSILANAQTADKPTDDKNQLVGDVGMALYRTPPVTRASGDANVLLPYAFADYGNFFARVDTFGVKLMPMGVGSLELSARVSFEGYKPVGFTGIQDRSTPLPIGLSTFQETAYGAFFVYGFYDTNSGGTLLDATYAAEFRLGGINIYPQLGVERRSAAYVQHLYGVSAQEASASGLAVYNAGNSISPNLGFAFEYPFENNYSLTLQVRKKWLDSSITDSPLVNTHSQLSSFLSLTRSFK